MRRSKAAVGCQGSRHCHRLAENSRRSSRGRRSKAAVGCQGCRHCPRLAENSRRSSRGRRSKAVVGCRVFRRCPRLAENWRQRRGRCLKAVVGCRVFPNGQSRLPWHPPLSYAQTIRKPEPRDLRHFGDPVCNLTCAGRQGDYFRSEIESIPACQILTASLHTFFGNALGRTIALELSGGENVSQFPARISASLSLCSPSCGGGRRAGVAAPPIANPGRTIPPADLCWMVLRITGSCGDADTSS